MGPDTPEFWIVTGVGTAVFLAVGRWVWQALTRALREWVREPVEEARERADVAAAHAEEVKEAIGPKNGNGNLMEIADKLLTNQNEMRAWMAEIDDWRGVHDAVDLDTREDVRKIEAHLGLETEQQP